MNQHIAWLEEHDRVVGATQAGQVHTRNRAYRQTEALVRLDALIAAAEYQRMRGRVRRAWVGMLLVLAVLVLVAWNLWIVVMQ